MPTGVAVVLVAAAAAIVAIVVVVVVVVGSVEVVPHGLQIVSLLGGSKYWILGFRVF